MSSTARDGASPAPYADVTLAVIAGGRGERLGVVPKGLVTLEGETVIARVLRLGALVGETLLVANDPVAYAHLGVRTVADAVPGFGAPSGVHTALACARTPWVLAIACDMPFVTDAVARALLDARDSESDAVCFQVAGRIEPLLAVYRTSLADAFAHELPAAPSLTRLVERSRPRVLPEEALRAVDPGLRSVVSVNTPEDLARIGAHLPARD